MLFAEAAQRPSTSLPGFQGDWAAGGLLRDSIRGFEATNFCKGDTVARNNNDVQR